MPFPFNVRVYGALIHRGLILLSTESYRCQTFTKLPGGGLEFGEGTRDCLKREFLEETGRFISVGNHIYTTDYFQQSAFNPKDQVISIYYQVAFADNLAEESEIEPLEADQTFCWIRLDELQPHHLTFPIDQKILPLLKILR